MKRQTYSHGDGARAVPGYGGYADVARHLTVLAPDGRPVSRQLVFMWHRRRGSTGFPELHQVGDARLFKISETRSWYRRHKDVRAGSGDGG